MVIEYMKQFCVTAGKDHILYVAIRLTGQVLFNIFYY